MKCSRAARSSRAIWRPMWASPRPTCPCSRAERSRACVSRPCPPSAVICSASRQTCWPGCPMRTRRIARRLRVAGLVAWPRATRAVRGTRGSGPRLAWAVGGALLLHGLVLAMLSRSDGALRTSPERSDAPAMVWVTLVPLPASTAPSERPIAVEPAAPDGSVEGLTAALPVAPAPQAPASGPGDAPRAAPSMDDVAWAHQRWEVAPAGALGSGIAERDLRGAEGQRMVQAAGPWGTYCVELPSANQPPSMGAAPRVAPTSTCR